MLKCQFYVEHLCKRTLIVWASIIQCLLHKSKILDDSNHCNVPSFSPLCDKMHLELLDPLLSFHLRTILVVCEICQLLKSSLEFEKKGIIVSTTVESNSKLSTTTMKNSRFDEELSYSDVSYSLLENRCHCYSFLR